jgi:cytoskeletal protein RodZ
MEPRMEAPVAAPSSAAQKSSERDSGSRLPRRLEFLDEEPVEDGGKNLRWMIIAGFVAVIAVGAVLGIRTWMSSVKSTSAVPAAVEAPTTTTETTPSSSPTATSDPGTSASTAGGSAPASSSPPPVRPTPQTASSVPPAASSIPPATGAHPPASSVPAATMPPPVATSAPNTPTPTHGTATGVAGGAAGAAAASGGSAAAAGATAGGAAVGSASAGGAAVSGASAGGAAVGGQSATPSQGAFGIAVGTYLEEERAKEEGVKLTASTKLPAHVAPVIENESTMYRLVLGSFESRKQAEKTASSLIERGLVDEARVVPLGTTTASKQ